MQENLYYFFKQAKGMEIALKTGRKKLFSNGAKYYFKIGIPWYMEKTLTDKKKLINLRVGILGGKFNYLIHIF